MARSGVTALSLALMLALLEFGSCLRCYQCLSTREPTCKNAPAENLLTDCSAHDAIAFNQVFLNAILPPEIIAGTVGSARYCHKIILENGEVARTCLDGNAIKVDLSCTIITAASKILPFSATRIKECHVCDKNECNGAGSIAASLPLGLVALFISYLYIKQ